MSKNTLIALILATSILGAILQYFFCCKDKVDATATATEQVATGNGLMFKGSSLDYKCDDNFNFNENDLNFVTPVSACIDEGIAKLKEDLAKNPNQKMMITGYCTSTEPKSKLFPNLGFDRANAVKNYFVSKGIPANVLDINGEVKDGMTATNGVHLGPINYALSDVDANAPKEDWAKIREEINAEPLVVYFDTNSSELNLSDADKAKVAKIQKYMDHVADAKLSVTGHTDNVGNHDANVTLSKKRADFIADYFSKNTGITVDRMATAGKGPDEPIADNGTAEGKAKNRRTVVQIQ